MENLKKNNNIVTNKIEENIEINKLMEFIKDIKEMAKKAEDLEGHGVVLKDSRKK